MEILREYIWVFFVSMLPIVELRGAIPIGTAMGLDFFSVYIVSVIGNIFVVPFLILFSKKVLNLCVKIKYIGKYFQKIIDKANEKARKIGKYELLGIFLFVAIPLPGTGAWTGSLISAVLQLRLKQAFVAIALGVLTSGLIMGAISYGILGIINIF